MEHNPVAVYHCKSGDYIFFYSKPIIGHCYPYIKVPINGATEYLSNHPEYHIIWEADFKLIN